MYLGKQEQQAVTAGIADFNELPFDTTDETEKIVGVINEGDIH